MLLAKRKGRDATRALEVGGKNRLDTESETVCTSWRAARCVQRCKDRAVLLHAGSPGIAGVSEMYENLVKQQLVLAA